MKSTTLNDHYKEILFTIPLFRDMKPHVKSLLPVELDMRVFEVEKGEIIAHQGDLCRQLYVILKGVLEVNIIESGGNNVFIEHLIAPRVFATPHLFKEDNRLPATFTAIEECVLLTATKESTFRLISNHPEVLRSFLCIAGNCNECTTTRLDVLSRRTVRERLLVYLFKKKPRGSSVVRTRQTLTQLADYLNVSRPALSSEISKMEREGLITRPTKDSFELNLRLLQQPI